MIRTKAFILFLFFFVVLLPLKGEKYIPAAKSDSLTLAQAYINLSLTAFYFDSLSQERISIIIPFLEQELKSIEDSTFIKDNAVLYDFTHALLYFNKANFLFDYKQDTSRNSLLLWKETLGKSIQFFNRSRHGVFIFNNTFYEYINFSNSSYADLFEDIILLKSKLAPLFNQDIYPEFKKIFWEEKNTGRFKVDSLLKLTALYDLPLSTDILNNETVDGRTHNPVQHEYDTILSGYPLDSALDLISRYLQLRYLSKTNTEAKSNIKNSCDLYVQFRILEKEIIHLYDAKDTISPVLKMMMADGLLKRELNASAFTNLQKNLTQNYRDCFTFAQAFIELINDSTSIDEKRITRIEEELHSIRDSAFINRYSSLYNTVSGQFYSKKAHLKFKNRINVARHFLIDLKNTVGQSVHHYNHIGFRSYFPESHDGLDGYLYDFIQYNSAGIRKLYADIITRKEEINPYFNADIYPDFKRIFYLVKKGKVFSMDSLTYYTDLFNLPLSADILENIDTDGRTINRSNDDNFIYDTYAIDIALDLVSRFLQLDYIANEKDSIYNTTALLKQYHALELDLNHQNTRHFGNYPSSYSAIPKDGFFREELSIALCLKLYKKLHKIKLISLGFDGVIERLYHESNIPKGNTVDTKGISLDSDDGFSYHFPIPTPFPSSYKYIPQFKPELKTAKAVDQYFSNQLNKAGYQGHVQYYYVKSGYAMTTNLERINEYGSPVKGSQRWQVDIAGLTNPTMYTTFKSIFMKTEVELRMFAFVIMPAQAAIQLNKGGSSIGAMQNLIEHSYTSLPKDIESMAMDKKTLTILVYHYHQDDVGQVPMLDTSNKLSVDDHLIKSGLGALLKN